MYDCIIITWIFFFFKQKTAYEMRISDWSSDVCSSDLCAGGEFDEDRQRPAAARIGSALWVWRTAPAGKRAGQLDHAGEGQPDPVRGAHHGGGPGDGQSRSGDRKSTRLNSSH